MPRPEVTAMTGSIVLVADDPAALARFDGALLAVEPQPGLSTAHRHVAWPWRQECFGAEAWLLDPEGNRLLLLLLTWP